ncbi:MAG: signal peptide peptidase SppA [Sphingopyxis sp.]|nr:signal peptide peptidase SppA [Sphingopyxis sp.]
MNDIAAPAPASVPPSAPVRRAPPPPTDGVSFPRKVWRLLVAIKDALALLFLLLFFVVLFGLLTARPNAALPVSEGALLLKLEGVLSEQPADIDPFAALTGAGGMPVREYRVRDVVHALETAATDKRVKTVVLDLDSFMGGGQVALAEVGEAIGKVRAAKKPVLAFASAYGDDAYQLAAHASEIWVDPIGGALITGPGGTNLYYKELLDKLGVTANVYRVGTFKSAVEPFIRSDQSPEAEAAARAYVDVIWTKWQDDVAKARPKAKLAEFIANPVAPTLAAQGDLATAALRAGLVDKIGGRLAFEARVGEIAGRPDDNQPWAFNAIDYDAWLANNPFPTSGAPIAVIPVVGEIVDGEQPNGTAGGDTIAGHILTAIADSNVRAVVLRVDSPGGSVMASEQIRQALLRAKAKKLPIVVSMANVAASGGYWVATPADRIFAEPDTITGSIGVFGILPSFEKALDNIGVGADGIKTGPLSGEPNILGGVSPEFNQMAQASVENMYARFTGLVANSRKMDIAKVREIAEGRVWAGGTARQLGLVDQFGGIDDAVAYAAKLAKVQGEYYPLYFENAPDPFAQFLAAFTQQAAPAAANPRGWFALAGVNRQLIQARLVQDMSLLAANPSVQAACLECRGWVPAVPRTANKEVSWLTRLLD